MQAYVDQYGISDSQKLIDVAYGLVTKYGEGSAALASEMYDALAELQGAHVPAAEPAETAEYGEVARMVNATKNSTPQLKSGVSRLVKRAGADTMLKNALRDGAEFAWVPNGDTCAFCMTLASRGWQKASKKAIKNGHAEHIHAFLSTPSGWRATAKTDKVFVCFCAKGRRICLFKTRKEKNLPVAF